MDDFVGQTLVAVERLSFAFPTETADTRVGPVHLQFDDGFGVFFSGATDWSLDTVITRPGDESWLVPFQYEFEGGVWTNRDAFDERPFAECHGASLVKWEPILNEVGELVGVILTFERADITLRVFAGEVQI